jgi:hypothetical protein
MVYDLTDLRQSVLTFANNSTNQSAYCISLVCKMPFQSEVEHVNVQISSSDSLAFYDVEVFPNLFIVCWKFEGEDKPVTRMINPSAEEIGELFKLKLVGFNCRKYDNHILYKWYIGCSNEDLYRLSQQLIKQNTGYFREAYNISYTDIWDFNSNKQGLKKWEIDLGIHHLENSYDWDLPVPEENWDTVAEYCENDVIATEKVFHANKGAFLARQILADLAGGSVNDTTNQLTAKIIFGDEKHPKLIYTDLATGEQY